MYLASQQLPIPAPVLAGGYQEQNDGFGPGSVFTQRFFGKSMEPTITGGSWLFCRRVSLSVCLYGEIYLIASKSHQTVFCGRLCASDRPGYITLKRDNPKFDPIEFATNDIIDLAQVIGVITKLAD